jgi:DNA-binding transcriptional LysR family regulator
VELRLLNYFVALAEELHFSRAAARLNMAQPSLSQQIRHLEDELGVALLVRDKRNVALTEPGRLFLASAREILAQVDRSVLQVRRANQGEVGQIDIGIVGSAIYEDTLLKVLSAHRKHHPEVAIVLHEMSTGEQLAALREGRILIGFLRPPVKDSRIALLTVFREPLVAVLPPGHLLAAKECLPLSALAEDPFIMFPRNHGQGLLELVLGACAKAGFTPQIAQEAREIHTILGLVAAGFGVSILPQIVCTMGQSGSTYRSITRPNLFIEIAAAYLGRNPSPILTEFLATLRGTISGSIH